MGTFLGSYRLEKRSKSHGVSENSITIGIPIQMEILKFRHGSISFRSWSNASRKTTSRQGYLLSELFLEIQKSVPGVFYVVLTPILRLQGTYVKPCRQPGHVIWTFLNISVHTFLERIIYEKKVCLEPPALDRNQILD